MSDSSWKANDTERALEIWNEYQAQHDLSDRKGQTAGIVPDSGEVWFGESGLDIARQMVARNGVKQSFHAVRVGKNYYVRKGGRPTSREATVIDGEQDFRECVDGIQRGLAAMEQEDGIPLSEAVAMLRKKHNIPKTYKP